MTRLSRRGTQNTATLERYVIPNLRNASRIMKLLAQNPDGHKAADIARALKIPVTTTLRIMATLQLEGFVRKADGRFELGPVLIHLGNASLAGTEIRTSALPVLQDLTNRTDETSHLAVPCDDRALIVAVQDSPHPLRAASRPGFAHRTTLLVHGQGLHRLHPPATPRGILRQEPPHEAHRAHTGHPGGNQARGGAHPQTRLQPGRRGVQPGRALLRRAGPFVGRHGRRRHRHHGRHGAFHPRAHPRTRRDRRGLGGRAFPAPRLPRRGLSRRSCR